MIKFNALLIIILSIATTLFAEGKVTSKKTLLDFITPPTLDKYNDTLEIPIKPTPGGEITIRIPQDPKNLNPITNNGAQAQKIMGYLFDSLITRHSETLEWLPWIAKHWEEKDLVQLEDGENIEGKIIAENDTSIVFIKDAGKIVLGKHDIASFDIKSGKVIMKDDTEYNGEIKELVYTIELQHYDSANRMIIPIEKIADNSGSKHIVKNAVYYFTLRDNIKWHDGKDFTVEDIKFSFDTIMNKYVDAASLRNYYNDIKKLEIVDNKTVKFVYGKSYFLSLSFCGGISIFPKHIYNPEQFGDDKETFGKFFNQHESNKHPVGNSAYRLKSWEKGKQIVIEKNKDYWASKCGFPYWEKDQPYLDKITWIVINNKTAALKELQNGNIDVDFDIEPDIWFSEMTNRNSFTKNFARAHMIVPMYSYVGWNSNSVYFKDKLVRKAMTHLIPLKKIASDIHKNLVTPVTGPFYINGPVYDHDLEPYENSLKKAKRLLRKAGWLDHDGDGIIDKNSIPFEFEYLIHTGRDYHQKIADIIKESIEQAGIKMIIRKLDWSIFGETVSDRKFDAVRFAWGTGIDSDPYQIWHSSQAENRGSNYVGFKNNRVDEILEQARKTFDPLKRWNLYREMHTVLYEEQPYSFMFCFQTLFFYNKKIRNVKIYSTRPGYNLTEWYIHQPNIDN